VPVEVDLRVDRRLPEPVEVASYFVVAEAVTNAAKHAQASVVNVSVVAEDATVHLSIRDDGIGGADAANGSGLTGLIDAAEATRNPQALSYALLAYGYAWRDADPGLALDGTSRRGWPQPRSVERLRSRPAPSPAPILSCPMAPKRYHVSNHDEANTTNGFIDVPF
jgi:hypothetical protein